MKKKLLNLRMKKIFRLDKKNKNIAQSKYNIKNGIEYCTFKNDFQKPRLLFEYEYRLRFFNLQIIIKHHLLLTEKLMVNKCIGCISNFLY